MVEQQYRYISVRISCKLYQCIQLVVTKRHSMPTFNVHECQSRDQSVCYGS